MKKDIFSGDVVAEIEFPRTNFYSPVEKRDWAIKELEDYVIKKHGAHLKGQVLDNDNRSGRLTGIKISITLGERVVTYALIEPSQAQQRKVLISRSEDDGSDIYAWDAYCHSAQQPKQSSNPFAAAFAKAAVNVDELKQRLPADCETMILRINQHPKTKQPAIKPQYMENDPVVGGKKSMRIFHVVSSNGELRTGEVWMGRSHERPVVSGTNKQGVPIVHVNVRLMETIKRR